MTEHYDKRSLRESALRRQVRGLDTVALHVNEGDSGAAELMCSMTSIIPLPALQTGSVTQLCRIQPELCCNTNARRSPWGIG